MASLLASAMRRHTLALVPTLRTPAMVPSAISGTSATGEAKTLGITGFAPGFWGPLQQDTRGYRHRGVLKLHCSECRYVIRRWHVPILAVDCNANVRHKQALTNPPIRSRWTTQFPDHLAPWVEGKQYPRHPRYRQENTFQCYHKKRHLRLR
eukprot:TRINITY_DN4333_c0_g1_i9.p1 TRINITY_DN4333_c0_g1~~TRINITY_DN4333_c0_g1_i9.p1  ORF type:complete len:152 (-),score=10.35 TRINITY_DN4333_c0_g1_i9:236-691(-)